MSKAIIMYECTHSLRAGGLYDVLIVPNHIDVQDYVNKAKAKFYEEDFYDWQLDDIYETFDFEFECCSFELCEV